MVYVALLRGINVGGKTMINMAALADSLRAVGLNDVKTYINSGNIIFSHPKTSSRQLEHLIEQTIEQNFSLNVKLVVRDKYEIEQIISSIPDSWNDNNTKKCNVIFLHHSVDEPSIVRELAIKPNIEELHYCPGALLWAANTSDLTKSNMIKLSAKQIYQNVTVRNLNTTRKIYQMMQDLAVDKS